LLKKMQLHWKILTGMCLGFILGLLSRVFVFFWFVIDNVSVAGDLFLRALKMIIIPLVVSSIVTAVAETGTDEKFGRLGFKTFLYYVSTTLFAIVTGLVLANIIQPGVGADLNLKTGLSSIPSSTAGFRDILVQIIPTNPFESMVKGEMVPLIFFSLCFGFFITRIQEPYRDHLKKIFQGIFKVMMLFAKFIISFAPLGVMALIAGITAIHGLSVFIPLGRYMFVVIAGLFIHAAVILPLMLFMAGINPLAHFRSVTAALATAFSTASSSATLPVTIESVRQNSGVSRSVSGFVLPLGATVNMDGTALYECVAAIFIAQAYGIDLGLMQQVLIVVTALLASIGAAAIPMAGLVMIVIILQAVGLPLEGVGLILSVDRVLDMLRTAVNVWSDSCGAVIIAQSEGEKQIRVARHPRKG